MQTDDLFNRFLQVIDTLEDEGVDYILIGGFAMVLYGMPRVTQDLDLFIENKNENIDKLQNALNKIFNDKSVYEITADELKKYSVLRYGSEEGFFIDVISSIGTAFTFEDIEHEEIEIEGHRIKIATVDSLYRLKENTFRAIDKNDLLFLNYLKDKGRK